MEAETNRALVAAAHRLVVLADHTKWDTVGISTIAALTEADVLITDAGLRRGTHAVASRGAHVVGELISRPDWSTQ